MRPSARLVAAWLSTLLSSASVVVGTGSWTGETDDGHVTVIVAEELQNATTGGSGHTSTNELIEWEIAPVCGSILNRHDLAGDCPPGQVRQVAYCMDGSQALDPLWSRTGREVGGSVTWTVWTMVRWHYCPDDSALLEAIRNAWDAMPISPSPITLQPPDGWAYADVPVVAMTDGSAQRGTYTLLGRDVILRATPTHFTWDWGDGTSWTTTHAGSPWPEATVTHSYHPSRSEATVSLTTAWEGHYSLDGGSNWTSAPGTAYTTSPPVPLDILAPRVNIVDCDVNDVCGYRR